MMISVVRAICIPTRWGALVFPTSYRAACCQCGCEVWVAPDSRARAARLGGLLTLWCTPCSLTDPGLSGMDLHIAETLVARYEPDRGTR